MFTHCLKTIPLVLIVAFLLIPHTRAAESNILILGDSISAAYGVETQKGWVQLLQKQLSQDKKHYQVINASISGETTAGGLKRLPQLLEKYSPSIVVIELGGNDGLRGFPIAQFRSNLKQLIQLSQGANAKVLLAGMRIPPNYGKRYTQMFYDSYQLSAEQYSVSVIPFLLEGIATSPDLMQPDRIHPNTQAQALILQNVMPHLKELL